MKKNFKILHANWWLLPSSSVLVDTTFILIEKVAINGTGFADIDAQRIMPFVLRLIVMISVWICVLILAVKRWHKRYNWRWKYSFCMLLISTLLLCYYIVVNQNRFVYYYNRNITLLFGRRYVNLPTPLAESVAIRPLGKLSYDGESVRLYGSNGVYRLIASINTHMPGKIYLKVYEIDTGIRLSSGSIKRNTVRDVKYSNNTNEWFSYDSVFAIREGKIGEPYGARLELWFAPSGGEKEKLLWSSQYFISGCCK